MDNPIEGKEYLTPNEFAAALPKPMDPRTVRRWCEEGKIASKQYFPGAPYAIPVSEFHRVCRGWSAGIEEEGEANDA